MAKKYTGRSGAAARASGRGLAIDKPEYQARKSAAGSMKQAGVQSLSGLSGSQGQVARFKSEQNKLRNEYKDKNTSDERKEEIIKDLRGVSRDLNDQSRAAALNQVIREFGPGSVLPGGGIMGSDAGARFQQLRGNPNFFVDNRPGTDTFVGNQREFKRGNITQTLGGVPKAFGDKNLFKQVHPNPLKILLGAATQAGNLSPLGLVRNINKIRTGEPLIDLSFMDRNMSESPSRLKNFYNAYMDSVNKKIQTANNEKFDKTPIDPQFQNVGGEPLDYGAQIAKEIFSEDPTGDPTRIQDDKDLQEDMERSLLNQYSLLEDPGLAETLLDETEETDLEEAINPVNEQISDDDDSSIAQYQRYLQTPGEEDPGYEQEFMDTYGYRFDRNYNRNTPYGDISPEDRKDMRDTILQEGVITPINEVYPKTSNFNLREDRDIGLIGSLAFNPGDRLADREILDSFSIPRGTVFSDKISDTPALGKEIRSADFSNLGYKDGGSVDTYDVLKLINDTMNDG